MILPVFSLFFLFSLLFLSGKCKDNRKTLYVILLFIWLVLALIATFRPFDMPDRENYIDIWYGNGTERYEIGFTTIVDLLQIFTKNEYAFLFVFAALSIALKMIAIYRITSFIWASLLIYTANIFILHDMIQIRCAIASGLLLWAVYYLVNRRAISFLVISIVAFLFHYSSIVIFPLWFLSINRSDKYFYMALIAFAYIVGGIVPISDLMQYIPIEGLQNLWRMYEQTLGDEVNVFNAVQLGRVTICLLLLYFIDRISIYNKYAILLVKIYAISIAALVLFSSVPVIAFRVSELYQVVEVVLIPMAVYAIKGYVFFKRTLVIIVGLAFLLMNTFYLGILK